MNISELRAELELYPQNMEVIVDMHSDYMILDSCVVTKAVPQGDWVMQSHVTMSDENKRVEKEYLYLG